MVLQEFFIETGTAPAPGAGFFARRRTMLPADLLPAFGIFMEVCQK
jgi:hypothetical protein